MLIQQIFSAGLAGIAGGVLFVMFTNRVLGRIPDNVYKNPAILISFLLLVGGSLIGGWLYPDLVRFPAALLVLTLLGELREQYIRIKTTGSPPYGSVPHAVQLVTPFTTTDLTVHRYQVELPGWRGERLRIVHLTDLHVNPDLPLSYFKQVMQTAREQQADLAVYTGDFVNRAEWLPQLEQALQPVGRLGDFAVLGNHDYWAGANEVRQMLADCGIMVITNEAVTIDAGGGKVAIAGYDYPWGCRHREIPKLPQADIRMVLSHAPDNIYRIARAGAELALCGHHHAGQFRLPHLGAVIIPSTYGRRFDHGHFVINSTHLFLPAGVGAANPPLRIYCQPDIFTVDIIPEKGG